MNKYAATGIVLEAAAGKRFAIVVGKATLIQEALDAFAEASDAWDLGATVRRVNGDERVSLPGGGTIYLTTPRRGSRLGRIAVDVVFIDNEAHRTLESDDHDPRAYDRFRFDVALALNKTAGTGTVVHS